MRHLSSIERYRAGELAPARFPYDMNDEGERATVTLTQMYIDYRERCALSAEEIPFRQPWELEAYLVDLRDHAAGERVMDYASAHDTVVAVFEALFDARGVAGHEVPGEFWRAGEGQHRESPLAPDRAVAALSGWVRAALGELVSMAELARREGVSSAAIHSRIQHGRYSPIRVGRSVLIPASELERQGYPR